MSRQISFQAAGNIAKWKARGQIKQKLDTSQPIDLKIDAKLESVNFYLMTSQVDLGMNSNAVKSRVWNTSWSAANLFQN